jgi:pSer/pThr/pTyr-binding forkhead associated (FHA) protein
MQKVWPDTFVEEGGLTRSRHHALDSNHGTYLNGLPIKQQELQSGDRISLGRDRVELVYGTGEGDTTTMAAIPAADHVIEEPKG